MSTSVGGWARIFAKRLLGNEVGFLVSILIAIDITLAGLFWALSGEHDVIAKFIRKVLYVGLFALILNNFQVLADIIFRSFAGLGLQATQTGLGPADLLRPGFIAGQGFQAAHPLIVEADTHQDLHTAAVVSHDGTVLGTESFSTTRAGYRAMLRWFRSHGELLRVGVESTGTYGAGITRHLALSGSRIHRWVL